MMDILNGYRDNHDVSSDSDSEDSDKECTVWKRATVKKVHENEISMKSEVEPPIQANPVRKQNTIWSEVLQDQLISEDLEDCLLKNKPRHYGSRGKESYDYTLRYTDSRIERDSDSHMSDSTLNEEKPKSKNKHLLSSHNKYKKFVKLNSAELTAARKINKILNEKKFYLIQRIVKIVGIEKAMNLLNMTQEIEENGGLMTNNNSRRRTPGGVYIQLLKTDKSITQEMIDKIFEGEMSGIELKKYYAERKKNKKKYMQNKRKANDSKEMSEIGAEIQKSDEIVSMDAEDTSDMIAGKSCLDNNPNSVTVFNKTSENTSDLEEGEIKD